MKDHIIKEIQRLTALNNGHPPGQKLFAKETGIPHHQWRGKFWSKWGDALIEAGLGPNDWVGKRDSDEVLDALMEVCRQFKGLPTRSEYELHRRTYPSLPSYGTIKSHFGLRANLIATLTKYASTITKYADVVTLLPPVPSDDASEAMKSLERPSKVAGGFVYLIQSGSFYKIGRSDDLERRVKEIRIALPDKAILAHTIRTDDPAGIEAYWHQRFKDKRANGEWFRLTPLDIAAFKKRKFQ